MDKIFIKEHTYSLLNWLERNNYSSFDHYDFWSSRLGVWSKSLFNRKKLFGIPFVAFIFILDVYFPHLRKFLAQKARSAEAIPRIAMGYFRLYQMTGDSIYLDRGCDLLGWLSQHASKTERGLGWGLHFNWQSGEFLPKGTPCITLTAYSTEAFLEGYRLTQSEAYLETALKTSDFVAHDLNRKTENQETAVSYTPRDQNYVINANSYAARILVDTLKYENDHERKELAESIINYILAQQNPDGSWFYFDRNDVPERKNFIDSFHTCFVLENLFLIWKWNKNESLKRSIDRGYNFFVDHFIASDFSVRYYQYYPYPTGIKVDIRGCAETIHCLALLSEIYPKAMDMAKKICKWTIVNMQDRSGFFYFRIYRTHKHKMSYMRWGQAPMFNALTYLLTKMIM